MTEKSNNPRRKLVLRPVACEAAEIGVWLAALKHCRERTHKAISGISGDELDRVGVPGGNSIGTLLYHIAAIELDWLYSENLEQEFPDDFRQWFPHDVSDSAGILIPVPGDSAQRHEERLHYVREKMVDVLSGMSDSEFRRVRRLKAYDATPQWVAHHLLQHEAGHRGQILLLRGRLP